jgi:hypothetical protein
MVEAKEDVNKMKAELAVKNQVGFAGRDAVLNSVQGSELVAVEICRGLE